MERREKSQSRIIENLRNRIEGVLMRPGMYVGDSPTYVRLAEFRDFIWAYVDALAIACGQHDGGGHMHGEIPRIDPAKTNAENVDAIRAAVKKILADVPINERRKGG